MAKKKFGLKSVKIGAIANDGGMGTVLTQVGNTVSESCTFTIEKGSDNTFNIEESDDPFLVITTPGKKMVAFSTYDTDPATAVKLFGGTVTQDDDGNDVWNAPQQLPSIEVSLELEMQKGGILRIPRAKLNTDVAWAFGKTALPQLNVEATILTPEKAGVNAFYFIGKEVTGAVAPYFTYLPQSKSLVASDALVLSATVAGTAPFSYQWKKNGVSIPGATSNAFFIEEVQVADAGDYTVVVSNGKGSITSPVATVEVQ